jgi:hypothetical protein
MAPSGMLRGNMLAALLGGAVPAGGVPTRAGRADQSPTVGQLASKLADESGRRTSRAMRAANNAVIDVRVTDYAVSDQAVRVVNAIAGRNPL